MNPFLNKNFYCTPLMALLIDAFGTEVLDWDTETIRIEVKQAYNTEIDDINMGKIMSGILLMTTDGFYRNLNQFIPTCNALSGALIDQNVFDPATVEECAWGVTEASLLDPTMTTFSDEIMGYMGVRLDYEGWSKKPEVLSMAVMPNGEANADEFSDDPVLFAGIWGAIRENERLLDETLLKNKQELLIQIQSLKLKHGSFNNLVNSFKAGNTKG